MSFETEVTQKIGTTDAQQLERAAVCLSTCLLTARCKGAYEDYNARYERYASSVDTQDESQLEQYTLGLEHLERNKDALTTAAAMQIETCITGDAVICEVTS